MCLLLIQCHCIVGRLCCVLMVSKHNMKSDSPSGELSQSRLGES